MENQINTKSIILNNGLYLGIIGVVIHLALWASGMLLELNWVNTVVWIAALVFLLAQGINSYKSQSGGYISWGQGLKIGMGIAMVSAVITLVYTFLFTGVIDPEFQNMAMEVQKQKWADAGLTEEQIETYAESAKNFQGPGMIAAFVLGIYAFLGFVISAITAAIMKKSEEEAY